MLNKGEGDHFWFQLSRGYKKNGGFKSCKDFHLHIHYHANQTHFIWKVSHKDSFWNGGMRELGKGLCNSSITEATDVKLKFAFLPHSLVWYFRNWGQWYWNFLGKSSKKIQELSNFKNAFTIQLKILEVLGRKSNRTEAPGKICFKILVHTEIHRLSSFPETADNVVPIETGNFHWEFSQ